MSIYVLSDDEFILDLKEWCKNNPLDTEGFISQKIPAWNKGIPLTEEWKEKISNSSKGKIQGVNQRKSARITAIQRNNTMLTCPNCGKSVNLGNYGRWHGDKCGKKTTQSTETKNKISESMKGRVFSEQHRRKLSDANRLRNKKN